MVVEVGDSRIKSFQNKCLGILFVLLLLCCLYPALGYTDDNSTVYKQYNDVQNELNAMRSARNYNSNTVAPVGLRSAEKNSTVRIGGELFVDYIGSVYDGNGVEGCGYDGGWALHNTNLRFDFNLSDNLRATVKLDLSDSQYRRPSRVMEEALLIWDFVCGGPVGLFFGVGEVPYGQDRTLGIIQSYNHTEGDYSSEGPVILSAPVLAKYDRNSIIYHPGEIDRVVMAGLSYTWDDIIKAEFAFFQPSGINDMYGMYDRVSPKGDTGFESFAGRVWWNSPIEGLVAEISGVRQHDRQRGDTRLFGSDAVEDEYAVSVGVDWNINNQLEVFAEYQHGFNWGFIEGYNTDTVSAGVLYSITDKITLGGMAEWLHISDNGDETDLNKFVLHTQYKFANGVYLIAEYGAELYNWNGAMTNMFALRSGVSF